MTKEESSRLNRLLQHGFTEEKISQNSVGLGFGLLISNNLARMIGDSENEQAIYFRSHMNKGSKFWIFINLCKNGTHQEESKDSQLTEGIITDVDGNFVRKNKLILKKHTDTSSEKSQNSFIKKQLNIPEKKDSIICFDQHQEDDIMENSVNILSSKEKAQRRLSGLRTLLQRQNKQSGNNSSESEAYLLKFARVKSEERQTTEPHLEKYQENLKTNVSHPNLERFFSSSPKKDTQSPAGLTLESSQMISSKIIQIKNKLRHTIMNKSTMSNPRSPPSDGNNNNKSFIFPNCKKGFFSRTLSLKDSVMKSAPPTMTHLLNSHCRFHQSKSFTDQFLVSNPELFKAPSSDKGVSQEININTGRVDQEGHSCAIHCNRLSQINVPNAPVNHSANKNMLGMDDRIIEEVNEEDTKIQNSFQFSNSMDDDYHRVENQLSSQRSKNITADFEFNKDQPESSQTRMKSLSNVIRVRNKTNSSETVISGQGQPNSTMNMQQNINLQNNNSGTIIEEIRDEFKKMSYPQNSRDKNCEITESDSFGQDKSEESSISFESTSSLDKNSNNSVEYSFYEFDENVSLDDVEGHSYLCVLKNPQKNNQTKTNAFKYDNLFEGIVTRRSEMLGELGLRDRTSFALSHVGFPQVTSTHGDQSGFPNSDSGDDEEDEGLKKIQTAQTFNRMSISPIKIAAKIEDESQQRKKSDSFNQPLQVKVQNQNASPPCISSSSSRINPSFLTSSMANLEEQEEQTVKDIRLNCIFQNEKPQRKILFVDDEIFNIYSLKLIFTKFGLQDHILEAYNGEQAIEEIIKQQNIKSKRNRFLGYEVGLIIMDVNMPLMNGIECTKRIRELTKDHIIQYNPRIIGYTAYSDSLTRNACHNAGMDDLLLKPSRREDFIRIIETYYLKS